MKYIIIVFFIILTLLSVIFFRERMLFLDPSHYFTYIINYKAFLINEYRFGCALPQLIPLGGAYLGLPVISLAMAYSVSFNLLYLAVASLLVFFFRNYLLAALMAFYYALFAGPSFFWMTNEVHQAVMWLFLLMAVVQDYRTRRYSFLWHFVLVFLLSATVIFTHPLMLLVFPYLWLFTITDRNLRPYNFREGVVLSTLLIAICAGKFWLMRHGWYDSGKTEWVKTATVKSAGMLFRNPVILYFFRQAFSTHLFSGLIFIAGLAGAIRLGKWLSLILTLIFAAAYLFSVGMTFDSVIPFYTDSELLPLIIIMSTPFVYYILPGLKRKTQAILTGSILAYCICTIVIASAPFTARCHWIMDCVTFMDRKGIDKGYIITDPELEKKLIMHWGAPVETMLASSMLGITPCKTLVVDDETNALRRVNIGPDSIADCFRTIPASDIDFRYFPVDTLGTYQQLPLSE